MQEDHIEEIMKRVLDMPKAIRYLHEKIIRNVLENVEKGISRHHLEVLKLLDEDGERSISQIGGELVISKPQMTRLIDELASAGAVKRKRDPNDRRKTIISLTQKGQEIISSTMDSFYQSVRERLKPFTEQELEGISASIDKLMQLIGKV